jgi:hypothetical protein
MYLYKSKHKGDNQGQQSGLRYDVSFKLVQTRIDLSIIQLLRTLTDALEHEWLRIKARVDTKDIQNNSRSGPVVPRTDDIPIADQEE